MLQDPAADDNKGLILDVLRRHLPQEFNGLWLEFASGKGQHVTHFAQYFRQVTFQPSDSEQANLDSISAYTAHEGQLNVNRPMKIDIAIPLNDWQENLDPASCDVIYNASMEHMLPWNAVIGLFDAVGVLLKPNGFLIIYGPYVEGGVGPDRNKDARHPSLGVRDLQVLAEGKKLKLIDNIAMPANNKTLVWKKMA